MNTWNYWTTLSINYSDAEAIAAQEKYIAALVRLVNPYTGYAYKDDPYIVGFEINNEPCHPGTVVERVIT